MGIVIYVLMAVSGIGAILAFHKFSNSLPQ